MSTKNAIVFDDDDLFRNLFTKIFSAKEIEVTTYQSPNLYFCSDPRVNSCPVETPCVNFLLTDNIMPDMTGLEFLTRLKHIGCKIPNCQKAIISGHWTDEDLITAKQLVSHVFVKSDSKELINSWIEESVCRPL
jgi:FixJ family two-component response regulator